MKRFALALLLVACGGDEKTTSDTTSPTTTTTTTTTTDTSQPDTTNPQTSALTGVSKPTNPDPEPTPNAGCSGPQVQNYTPTGGFEYPWQGATAGATTYTCDGCKTGDPKLQGAWRVHGFADSGDPDYSFPDPLTDYAETLKVDGNTFEIHIRDQHAAEGEKDQLIRGWYFCAQKPEANNEHLFWVITDVDQGTDQPGDVIESDVFLGSGDNIATYWFASVGASENDQAQYCKIGSTNSANADQTCTSPF